MTWPSVALDLPEDAQSPLLMRSWTCRRLREVERLVMLWEIHSGGQHPCVQVGGHQDSH